MGQVVVDIGGRNYTLSCRDGDEPHLVELAADIADKADGLTRSLGTMTEARLLLMAALMVADELHEVRNTALPADGGSAPATERRLALLLDRAETMVARYAD